jgi:hypothetical protein
METINPKTLDNFSSLPDSALDGINKNDFGIHEISDNEMFNTGKGAEGISIDEPVADKKNIKIDKSAQTTGTKIGNLIGGELAVKLLDIAIPAILVTAIYYVGYKLEKEKIKLTPEDRKVVAPVLQDALNAIEIDLNNPFANLALVLSIVYGMKLVELAPTLEKRTKGKVIKGTFSETVEHNRVDEEPIEKTDELKLSPATEFKEKWNELLKTVMDKTGRKSRKGAIGWIYKNEPQLAQELLNKYGFNEPPDDNDFKWVKKSSPTVNFSL